MILATEFWIMLYCTVIDMTILVMIMMMTGWCDDDDDDDNDDHDDDDDDDDDRCMMLMWVGVIKVPRPGFQESASWPTVTWEPE